ncbi:hypothetical protein [Streptomyces coelicoflavus]|uniref:hypothetical protein n=1 Tax=Streptomyces coelicoflavus TaxID=285562 RepID=UPI002E25423C
MLTYARPGDTVHISEMFRLVRGTGHILGNKGGRRPAVAPASVDRRPCSGTAESGSGQTSSAWTAGHAGRPAVPTDPGDEFSRPQPSHV